MLAKGGYVSVGKRRRVKGGKGEGLRVGKGEGLRVGKRKVEGGKWGG